MNPLLESIWEKGHLFDCLGLAGIGLVGLAATRMAARHSSWGGTMMACGAIALLLARFYLIVAPVVMTRDAVLMIGVQWMEIISVIPPLLLSFGLAGVVWGLWGHDRWRKAHSR